MPMPNARQNNPVFSGTSPALRLLRLYFRQMTRPILAILGLSLILTVLGVVLLYWSGELSLRYNAWTTRSRERYPHINPSPTPQSRELNTKIMTWLFRFLGACILLASILMLSGVWR